MKPLRDAIAAELGMDDADPRIRWQYGQTETRGAEGVLVMVEAPHPHPPRCNRFLAPSISHTKRQAANRHHERIPKN